MAFYCRLAILVLIISPHSYIYEDNLKPRTTLVGPGYRFDKISTENKYSIGGMFYNSAYDNNINGCKILTWMNTLWCNNCSDGKILRKDCKYWTYRKFDNHLDSYEWTKCNRSSYVARIFSSQDVDYHKRWRSYLFDVKNVLLCKNPRPDCVHLTYRNNSIQLCIYKWKHLILTPCVPMSQLKQRISNIYGVIENISSAFLRFAYIVCIFTSLNTLNKIKKTNYKIRLRQTNTTSTRKYESAFDFIFKLYNPASVKGSCYPVSSFRRYCDEVVQSKGKSRHLMHFEWARFQSLQTFPTSSNVSVIRLAKDGFYYTGSGEVATCFSCGAIVSSWHKGLSVRDVHRQASPNCDFINGRLTNNVSIHDSDEINSDTSSNSTDAHLVASRETLHTHHNNERASNAPTPNSPGTSFGRPLGRVNHSSISRENLPAPRANDSQQAATGGPSDTYLNPVAANRGNESKGIQELTLESRTENGTKDKTQKFGIALETSTRDTTQTQAALVTRPKPRYPEYAKSDARLASYVNWPLTYQEPSVLSACGLFHTGVEDRTRCYQCGGGLRNWDPEDDPWREHARWFPTCDHIRHVRGQDYINRCLRNDSEGTEELTKENNIGNNNTEIREPNNIARSDRDQEQRSLATVSTPITSNNDKEKQSPKKTPSNVSECSHSKIDRKALSEENHQLREQMMCKICMDRDANVVFLPCGHMVSCDQCARALRKCAVCRKYIKGTVRVFQN